ncbi:MAG TPA: cobalt-precorrin-5B (C(1))-methyltransferase [Desulfuromonadales bacterium]|nr:cobalt-precorrin-5B (C(1))-methyltransferase [Desulfuromonadales bacterium]
MKKTVRSGPSTPLRTGYTTGACAAAAAKGAALMLMQQVGIADVSIDLPTGAVAAFELHGQSFSEHEATCFVIKDAGDDPDVTHGVEVWARIAANPPRPPFIEGGSEIRIKGGTGIGKVTKPGLAIPPGEWAINPVPRKMIEASVRSAFSLHAPCPLPLVVTISIPDGEERAKKTLNARLGIIGGLSILGTTGIVRPISTQAWTDTIDAALDVAKACGCENVVLSTGRSSEMAAQNFFTLHSSPLTLPEEACIMMGDHVAYALQACAKRGFMQPIIACQFAKLLKIACGHENTHAAASDLDLAVLRGWAEAAGFSAEIIALINQANTAREIAVASGFDPPLMQLVMYHARQAAAVHAPGSEVLPLLCGYDGGVISSSLHF